MDSATRCGPGRTLLSLLSPPDDGVAHTRAGAAFFSLGTALETATQTDETHGIPAILVQASMLLHEPATHPDIPPRWYALLAWHHYVAGDHRAVFESCDRAEQSLAQTSDREHIATRVTVAGLRGLVHAAESYGRGVASALSQLDAIGTAADEFSAWWQATLRVLLALDGSDIRAARAGAPALLAASQSLDWSFAQALSLIVDATVAFEAGQHAGVRASLQRLRDISPSRQWLAECALLDCAFALDTDSDRYRAAADQALEPSALSRCRFLGRCCFRPYQRLFAFELTQARHANHVAGLIRRFGWPGPGPDCEDWPWRIRIVTLGRFAIERDGHPIPFPGKPPRRPLALLKAIVARGGRGVPLAVLAREVWSPGHADGNLGALEVALVRLRKILGIPRAVVVQDEHVSLDPALCWVDTWAFESATQDLASATPDSPWFRSAATRALRLYGGAFLPTDTEADWSAVARTRLRAGFCDAIHRVGASHEEAGRWDDAIACYRRGVATDELAETFYQGLMRCHLALGRPGEGMAVFRQLRQTLSIVVSMRPNADSEALAERLRELGTRGTDADAA